LKVHRGKEQPESELKRLREEQRKTRRGEVFGGLSPAEEADYNGKAERIRELEYYFPARVFARQ
jgi:hypothetical protein